jgi:hypothetical protein
VKTNVINAFRTLRSVINQMINCTHGLSKWVNIRCRVITAAESSIVDINPGVKPDFASNSNTVECEAGAKACGETPRARASKARFIGRRA